MKSNEYAAILCAVRAARDILQEVANPSYPDKSFPSETLRAMFYELNDMCITLTRERDAAKA